MTVAELIERLKKLTQTSTMEVWIDELGGEYTLDQDFKVEECGDPETDIVWIITKTEDAR
jgi:hypothetical protein